MSCVLVLSCRVTAVRCGLWLTTRTPNSTAGDRSPRAVTTVRERGPSRAEALAELRRARLAPYMHLLGEGQDVRGTPERRQPQENTPREQPEYFFIYLPKSKTFL